MKIYLTYIVALLTALSAIGVSAQTQERSTMRFERDEWDFGRIREVDGPVEYIFTFTNTGHDAIVIEKVGVSCGCTTPSYPKETIKPGESGQITIKYDPKERPGPFDQLIHIGSRGGRNKNVLRIRGEVIPRPRSIEEDYPYTFSDGLRISMLSLNFGTIKQGEKLSLTTGYVNTSTRPIRLDCEQIPRRSFLRVEAPHLIQPGERGEITVTYDLTEQTFYGRYLDRIFLTVNGRQELIPISTTFTAIDSTEGVDIRRSPGVLISPMFHDFGTVKRGEKLSLDLEITNEGHQALIVRWVHPREGVTTTLGEGLTVQPGDAVGFTIAIDTSRFGPGVNTKSVTLITNDPLRPVREIRLVARIM